MTKFICILTLILSFSAYSSTILLDQVPLPDVSPTTYFIADEENVACTGRYLGVDYLGDEVSEVLTPDGDLIAEVCTRFLKFLSMEGTGRLKDRGEGSVTVNWAGEYRFEKWINVFLAGCKKNLYALFPITQLQQT